MQLSTEVIRQQGGNKKKEARVENDVFYFENGQKPEEKKNIQICFLSDFDSKYFL